MKAVIFSKHGNTDQLQYVENHPKPVPPSNEVLVQVKACALNHLDIWTLTGSTGLNIPMPHILGCDVSGEIAELGSEVKNFSVGTKVIVAPGISCGKCNYCNSGWDSLCVEFNILGFQRNGGFAEFVNVPARNLIPITDQFSFEQWAAVPLVFLTAWHMLITRAELKPGETVLIHAAGSGIGSAAIQIAKHLGALVITTVGSEEKVEFAKKLGADHVINYKKEDFSEGVKQITHGQGVHVVLEHIGPETFQKSMLCLAKKGRLVTCGATSGPNVEVSLRFLYIKQLSILGCYMGSISELNQLLDWIKRGAFHPVIDQVFPLKNAAQALNRMLERKNRGKIVLKID